MFFNGCATPQPTETSKIEQLTMSEPETPMSLIESMAKLAETHATRLHPNYIWATLKDRDQDAEIKTAFELALAQGTRESRLAYFAPSS
jgi:hypothetical protein